MDHNEVDAHELFEIDSSAIIPSRITNENVAEELNSNRNIIETYPRATGSSATNETVTAEDIVSEMIQNLDNSQNNVKSLESSAVDAQLIISNDSHSVQSANISSPDEITVENVVGQEISFIQVPEGESPINEPAGQSELQSCNTAGQNTDVRNG